MQFPKNSMKIQFSDHQISSKNLPLYPLYPKCYQIIPKYIKLIINFINSQPYKHQVLFSMEITLHEIPPRLGNENKN